MSKKNKNLDRAKDMVSIDSKTYNSDFKDLLQNDLLFLLKDYFDLGDIFDISINKNTFDVGKTQQNGGKKVGKMK